VEDHDGLDPVTKLCERTFMAVDAQSERLLVSGDRAVQSGDGTCAAPSRKVAGKREGAALVSGRLSVGLMPTACSKIALAAWQGAHRRMDFSAE
jgi:hypothetical protein